LYQVVQQDIYNARSLSLQRRLPCWAQLVTKDASRSLNGRRFTEREAFLTATDLSRQQCT